VEQLIVYDYAIMGLWWFGGKLERVPSDIYSTPEANFCTPSVRRHTVVLQPVSVISLMCVCDSCQPPYLMPSRPFSSCSLARAGTT